MSEGYEKQAPLTGFDGLTDYRRPNSSPTTFRLTIDHTVQHLPALLPLPPPNCIFLQTKNHPAWLKIDFLFPGQSMEPKVLQEVCGGSYPPPLKLHLFCNKEPFSLAEDKIAVPRKNHGTHSSSGSAWRILYAERMQYLHVISYDTPGRKKRWSQERMTGRRKMGPTTIYKQVYGPADGQASHPRTSSSNSWKSREGRKVHQKAREGWKLIFSIVELDIK